MRLTRLTIQDCRNLRNIELTPGPHFNIIHGENGSGKTSLLEAIYLLGHGRSFRSHLNRRIIRDGCESLSVFGALETAQQQTLPIGIQRCADRQSTIRIGGETVANATALAELMPILLINPDSYQLLNDGPKPRRQFLNWGVFHVEPAFFPAWQRLQRLLKQRNAALARGLPAEQVMLWDPEFVELSLAVDEQRHRYIEALKPLFFTLLDQLFDLHEISLSYQAGWPREENLAALLRTHIERDRALGYTRQGPQRADVALKTHGAPAHDILSRGQQKLLVCALRLAQGLLLQETCQKACIYLIDDLPAELDAKHRARMLEVLNQLKAQVFVTTLDIGHLNPLNTPDTPTFHVEQGNCQPTPAFHVELENS